MANSDLLKAKLLTVKNPPSGVTILSSDNGAHLELTTRRRQIYSVVDSHGGIVRTVHAWLRSLAGTAGLGNSINTVDQYGRTATYLCRWIERSGPYPDLSVDDNILLLARHHLKSWLDDMRERGALAHNTLRSREVCIRSFLDWLTTEEAGKLRSTENSPYGRDDNLRYITATPTPRSPRFMDAELLVQILKGFYNECERCMFHTQFDTGLRITELVNLTQGDIPDPSMYNPAYEFIPLCAVRTKGRGGQKVSKITLISRAVLNRLKRYHSSHEYKLAPDWDITDPKKPAFLTTNQRKWSPRNASKQFKEAVIRAKVNSEIATHWLRHGSAFSVLRSDTGKSYEERMLVVQQMLGHASLKATEIYTHIPPAMLMRLTKAGKEMNRLHEAEFIRANTFLGPLQHSEKRGHHA
ncbi:tyrosine-type recombinase/integrase [Paraburkholderia dipogonis]|uniref:tyrosine-type recombinase/integrase n=1 Tax=Paraburkholderia dipogonis TaxID=1211383 RepID=UPI0038B71A9D